MPIEPKEALIGNRKYTFNTFPAIKGTKLFFDLLNLIGPFIGQAGASVKGASLKEIMEANVDMSIMAKAIGGLAQQMHDDKTFSLIMSLITLGGTRVDGVEITNPVFDAHFAGNYGELVRLLKAIVMENYSSFFGVNGIGDLIPSAVPGIPSNADADN